MPCGLCVIAAAPGRPLGAADLFWFFLLLPDVFFMNDRCWRIYDCNACIPLHIVILSEALLFLLSQGYGGSRRCAKPASSFVTRVPASCTHQTRPRTSPYLRAVSNTASKAAASRARRRGYEYG